MSNSINTQSRKRKQPINDSSLFLTPSIPTKRSTPIAMFFPNMMPFNGLVVMPFHNSKLIQTDPTLLFSTLTSSRQYDIEQEELKAQINELRHSKSDIQQQYESTVETIKRCLAMTRSLLIEKSQLEKKQARKKTMENRFRLGQFVTQRQGVTFVEQWIDGFEFSDKQRAKEQLTRTKENLDKERKILAKKRTFLQQQQQQSMIDETNNSNFNSQDIFNPVYVPSTKSKRTNKNLTIRYDSRVLLLRNRSPFLYFSPQKSASFVITISNGPLTGSSYHQLFSDTSNDSPYLDVNPPHDSGSSSSSSSSSNCSSSLMTLKDWCEYDEVLRLRQLTLKREECDLVQDLDKLDRERNIHIRELKRLYNEDHSRFNQNNILHDRYLILSLIGKGGFSEVHRAFDLREQCYVACKIHQLNKEWKEEKKANFIKHALREYNIHKHLQHKRKY